MQNTKMFSRRMLALVPAAALSAFLTATLPAARADVRYVSQTTFGDPAARPPVSEDAGAQPLGGPPSMRTTTYVKGMNERVETTMNRGLFHISIITVTQCGTHQTLTLDPALKIYTVAPIGVAQFGPPSTSRRGGGDAMPGDTPGVGHAVSTFRVQDLGADKVNNLDARHYKISVRTQTSGCLGDGDTTTLLEEWIAPIPAGLNCPERFSPSRTVSNANGCQITYEMKGEVAALQALSGGLPVRTRITSGDKVIAVTEVGEYSTVALPDSLFAVPADFQQVSEADFAKAQSEAMQKSITGRGK